MIYIIDNGRSYEQHEIEFVEVGTATELVALDSVLAFPWHLTYYRPRLIGTAHEIHWLGANKAVTARDYVKDTIQYDLDDILEQGFWFKGVWGWNSPEYPIWLRDFAQKWSAATGEDLPIVAEALKRLEAP